MTMARGLGARSLLGWTLVASAAGLMDPIIDSDEGMPSFMRRVDPFGVQIEEGVHVIRLYQEKAPIFIPSEEHPVAFRTTYLANLRVGNPPQEFNVMFDTGSGQVVVPHINCVSDTCRRHLRYDMAGSNLSRHVLLDGSPKNMTAPFARPDTVSIGFGVGEVKGEAIRDYVCGVTDGKSKPCGDVTMVVAYDLSVNPFSAFPFDGIVGLGLPALSMGPTFHFFQSLRAAGHLRENKFCIYFAEGGEGSELTLGGINYDQLASEVHWDNVVKTHMGHWQIGILGFHVGNLTLDICKSGGCTGVVDSGTSHIAIPTPHEKDIYQMLSKPADGITTDCRYLTDLPPIIVELAHFNLTLYPEDYMRQLPVPEDLMLGAGSSNQTDDQDDEEEQANGTEHVPAPRQCRPRVVGITMPPEIGDRTFILGQSVMHRYYTVFDYGKLAIGFGLAASRVEDRATEVEEFKRRAQPRPPREEDEDASFMSAEPPHIVRQAGKKSTTTTTTTLSGPQLGEGLLEFTLDKLREEEGAPPVQRPVYM